MYDVCKAWNAVWDDNGGLGSSAGKGWYAEKTGDFNTGQRREGEEARGRNDTHCVVLLHMRSVRM